MVEQRGQMVAWLRKMVRRGSTDEDYEDAESASTGSSRAESGDRPQTLSAPNPNLPRQRLNIQDSASVMTIASSSKRRRQSIDTNASTRGMAAESVFSWSSEQAPQAPQAQAAATQRQPEAAGPAP